MRAHLTGSGRILLVLMVLAAVVYATTRQWHEVSSYLAQLPVSSLLLSQAAALAGIGSGALAFAEAMRATGHRVAPRAAARIYLVGLLGKYLPGSLWAFVLQAELGKRAGVPRSRLYVAALLVTAVFTACALVVGTFAIPALTATAGVNAMPFLLLAGVATACLHPRVLTRATAAGLKLLKQQPLPNPFDWNPIGRIAGWCLVSLACFGFHLWLLAVNADGGVGLPTCAAATGLGLTAGLLAFVLPSGLGAREAVLVAVLCAGMPTGAALGVALVSRMSFIVADLLAAGAAALPGRRTVTAIPNQNTHPTQERVPQACGRS